MPGPHLKKLLRDRWPGYAALASRSLRVRQVVWVRECYKKSYAPQAGTPMQDSCAGMARVSTLKHTAYADTFENAAPSHQHPYIPVPKLIHAFLMVKHTCASIIAVLLPEEPPVEHEEDDEDGNNDREILLPCIQ
jgi:hypothetical protein